MTIIEGQIESLKRIKEILSQKGITRFNSIGEINNFIKNYGSEKDNILKEEEETIDLAIRNHQSDLIQLQKQYDEEIDVATNYVDNNIKELKNKFDLLTSKRSDSFIIKTFYLLQLKLLKSKITNIEKNYRKIIQRKTKITEVKVNRTSNILEENIRNREKIISDRCLPRYSKLEFTKNVIKEINPLIAGAIGENLVVKELSKFSDRYVLLNDFSISFQPPIFNKKENDRIFSIQIDHLLITNSGVFILETKNWSRKSIENYDLRSPVNQIKRTSYALFVITNSDSRRNKFYLNSHHWGKKQIPIRNIIVMINEKPKEYFQYVKILSLNELNGYISHFESVFDEEEVKNLSDHLRMIQRK